MDDHLEQKPVVANIDGRATEISETRLRGPERGRRLTWHWYWVDGRIVASPAVAKLLQAKAKLLGRDQRAAAIALSTNEGIDPEEARRAMQTLLAGASFLTRMLNDARPGGDGGQGCQASPGIDIPRLAMSGSWTKPKVWR